MHCFILLKATSYCFFIVHMYQYHFWENILKSKIESIYSFGLERKYLESIKFLEIYCFCHEK